MEHNNFTRNVNASDGLVGRREEIQILKESLFKKRMKNTIIIGNAGCGKTAMIEQFVYEMKAHFRFIELDIGACVAGTTLRGQFEEKLINFLNEVSVYNKKNEKKIVLFVDEIHNIYHAGGSDGAVDASNILKTYLSRGEIIIIGATTPEEYKNTIKKDNALNRRLSPIFLKDLGDNDIMNILEKFNEGILEKELVAYIYEKSKELGRTNPDISIEILDRCLAKKKFTGNIIKKTDINKIVRYIKGE